VLLDFGIAKRVTDGSSVRALSIDYAPIEQVKRQGTDRRSDLYSLGVTAYELLTGHRPPNAIDRADGAQPPMLGEDVPHVPPALEATLLALLGFRPEERPPDARAALALLDEGVDSGANRPSASAAPLEAGPLSGDVRGAEQDASTVLSARQTRSFTPVQGQLDCQGRGRIAELAVAPDGRLLAAVTPLGVYVYDAQSFDDRSHIRASGLVRHAGFVDGGRSVTGLLAGATQIWQVFGSQLPVALVDQADDVTLAASAGGVQRVALVRGGSIEVWQAGSRVPVAVTSAGSSLPTVIALSPDGRFLAWAGRALHVLRVDDGQAVVTADLPATATALAFDTSGDLVAVAVGRAIQLRRVADGRVLANFDGHAERVIALAFAPNSQALAAAAGTTAHLWRLADSSRPFAPSSHATAVVGVGFVPNGAELITATGAVLCSWSVRDGTLLRTRAGHLGRLQSCAFSPDGRFVATMCGDITLWEREGDTLRQTQTISGHAEQHNGVVFSRDGVLLAAASSTGVTLVRVADSALVHTFDIQPTQTNSLTLSADHTEFIVVGATVERRRVADGTLLEHWPEEAADVYDFALAADGSAAAALTSAGVIIRRFADAPGKALTIDLAGGASEVSCLALAADGETLFVAAGNTTRVWRNASQIAEHEIPAGAQLIVCAPDGVTLALVQDNTIAIWCLGDSGYRLGRRLVGHAGPVSAVAFAPDTRALASVSFDGTLRLWKLE
jgi:WD40 repeat protein